MHLVTELGIPAKPQDWVLALAIRTTLCSRRNDHSFPGGSPSHGTKHACNLFRNEAEHPTPCNLRVFELQHADENRVLAWHLTFDMSGGPSA